MVREESAKVLSGVALICDLGRPCFQQIILRRFGAKPDKKIVDGQAASPSSWKTPFIAARVAW